MSDIALVQEIIDKTGITKFALAKFLGINNSLLTRLLSGTRNLPLKAFGPIVQVHAIVSQLPKPPALQPTPDQIAQNQQQAQVCTIKIAHLQKQLTEVKALYLQAQHLLLFLEQYNPHLFQQANPTVVRCMDEQRHEAAKKLQLYGWETQQQLMLKIAHLQAELALYEQITNEAK